jgi:membrane protease YdiL (CAAX protease family)
LLLFDHPPVPTYSSRQGLALLLAFLFLEILRSLLDACARWWNLAGRDWWPLLQLSLLTALACWLVAGLIRVPLRQLGLYPWFRWSTTEKFYLLQVVPIAVIVFSFFVSSELKALWARPHLASIGLYVFVPKMIWGFYQEFVYRGVLQTELVRRCGFFWGILASNLVFTFGPLHAYHFLIAIKHPSHMWIFAGIFGIGLFFALIFQRSGNLWIVAIMHGLGDWFIDGLTQVSRMAS